MKVLGVKMYLGKGSDNLGIEVRSGRGVFLKLGTLKVCNHLPLTLKVCLCS